MTRRGFLGGTGDVGCPREACPVASTRHGAVAVSARYSYDYQPGKLEVVRRHPGIRFAEKSQVCTVGSRFPMSPGGVYLPDQGTVFQKAEDDRFLDASAGDMTAGMPLNDVSRPGRVLVPHDIGLRILKKTVPDRIRG